MSASFSHAVLDSLDAHIAILDESGVILYTNKAWRAFAERNGVESRTVSEGVDYLAVCDHAAGPEAGDARAFAAGIRDVIAHGSVKHTFEYACDSPDERRWFIGRITRFEQDGKPRIVVAHENITERKQFEAEATGSRSRFETVFKSSPISIAITRLSTNQFIDVNDEWEKLTGYSRDEAVGHTAADLDLWYDPVERLRLVTMTKEELAVKGLEIKLKRRFGNTAIVLFSAVAINFGDEECMLSMALDISYSKRVEKELQKSSKRLQALSHRLLEVQETERKHIASELHDEIGQILTAVKLNLHGIQRYQQVQDIPQKMEESLALVEHSLQQVRALAVDLHPWMLDQLGLIPSLRWHLDHHAQRAGLHVRFDADTFEERFPPDIEIACFRVVQEALTNIIRYAQATEVRVSVTQQRDQLSIEIADNGIGFEVESIKPVPGSARGFGLMSMQERVTLLNGTFQLSSRLKEGTRISFALPLVESRI